MHGKPQPAQKRVSRRVEATIWWARAFFIFQSCRLGFSFFALAGARSFSFFYIAELQLTGGWLYAGETCDFNLRQVHLSVKNYACYQSNQHVPNLYRERIFKLQDVLRTLTDQLSGNSLKDKAKLTFYKHLWFKRYNILHYIEVIIYSSALEITPGNDWFVILFERLSLVLIILRTVCFIVNKYSIK